MTNRTKIYFIIAQRKIVSLKDLQDITRWKPITILRAVAPLIIKRKIKAHTQEHTRYFTIINKPLKNG
jgi:hypothetical protein